MDIKTETKYIGKEVKIIRKNPDNIRAIPVNDLIVTHSNSEFFLTFSLIEPPAILEQKELSDLNEVEAIARAKFVISPEFAEAITNVLSKNIEKFRN